MRSRDDTPVDGADRRNGWLQRPFVRRTRDRFTPAFSVWERLLHVHDAPLMNLRHSFWWFRKTFFTKPPAPTPAFLVDMTKSEVVRLFGRRHFDPGWELSYNYHGEVLNLRRVEYVDHERYNWWQVHIRGFLHDAGGIELTAHYETEPAEHPDAHIALYGLDVDRGLSTIEAILVDDGIAYERLSATDRSNVDP